MYFKFSLKRLHLLASIKWTLLSLKAWHCKNILGTKIHKYVNAEREYNFLYPDKNKDIVLLKNRLNDKLNA